MVRYRRYAVQFVGIVVMGLPLPLFGTDIGLAPAVKQGVLVGSLVVAGVTAGWLNLEGDDEGRTVAGSRIAFGALQGLLWVSVLLSMAVLMPGRTPGAAFLDGPLGAVAPVVLVVTFVVLVTTSGIASEYAPSALRRQYREGKRTQPGRDGE